MWKKLLFIIFLFYLFALLQNSFLTHFSLFGATPNLVFILFFLFVFFEGVPGVSSESFLGHSSRSYVVILLALAAGFFLDIFSYTYLGPSIVFLIIISFLLKGTQSLLKSRKDNYPLVYFLPLFVVFWGIYNLLLSLYFYFIDSNKIIISFGTETIFAVIYNLVIASVLFYLYKKALSAVASNNQPALFRK